VIPAAFEQPPTVIVKAVQIMSFVDPPEVEEALQTSFPRSLQDSL
jgi:hypothetical protein